MRRIGKCNGSFECPNQECPLIQSSGSSNKHQFKTLGNEKFCFSCGCVAVREYCGAVKLIEYSSDKKTTNSLP